MRIIGLLLLLVSIAASQYIILPDDDAQATVEYIEDTHEKCMVFDIVPEPSFDFDFAKLIETACSTRRKQRSSEVKSLLDIMFGERPRNQEMAKKLEYLTDVLEMSEVKLNFEKVSKLLNWNGTVLQETFKYPEGKIADAWTALYDKQFRCDPSNRLELEACGRINDNRLFGNRKVVVPLGEFSSQETIYKYRDIPEYGVMVHSHVTSVDSCVKLSSYWECYARKNATCSVKYFENCEVISQLTQFKIFTRNYHRQYTIVAANMSEYTTNINGTVEHHKIEESKHVVLKLPFTAYAKFGGIKIYGIARKNYDHFSVHNRADSLPLTHEDLDEMAAKYGEDHPVISDHRALLPSKTSQFVSDHHTTIILIVLLGVIVLAAVGNMIYCIRRCHKQKVIQEAVVEYINGECYIHEL